MGMSFTLATPWSSQLNPWRCLDADSEKKRGLGIPGIGGFYPNGNRVATQGYTKIYRSNHSKCNWQRNNISTVSERLARPFQNCLVNKESTMDYDTGL